MATNSTDNVEIDVRKNESRVNAKCTLEELLDGINQENLHGETDFGKDVGKEIVDYGI